MRTKSTIWSKLKRNTAGEEEQQWPGGSCREKKPYNLHALPLSPPHLTKNLLLSEKRKQKYGGVRFFTYLTQPIIFISEKVSQLQKEATYIQQSDHPKKII